MNRLSVLSPAEKQALTRARRLLGIDKRRFAISVLLGTLGLCCSLGLAAVAAWIIAKAAQQPLVLTLSVAATSVRFFGVGKAGFRYAERLSSHAVALRAMAALRTRIYTTLAINKNNSLAHLSRGDLLVRVSKDVDTLGDYIIKSILPSWVGAIVSTVAVVIVGIISWPAGLSLAICLMAAGIIGPLLSAKAAKYAESEIDQSQKQLTELSMTMLDNCAQIQVSNALDVFTNSLAQSENRLNHMTSRCARPLALATAFDNLCMGISVLCAMITGIIAVTKGQMDPVLLAVIVMTPLAAFEGTSMISEASIQKVRCASAAQRLLALLNTPESTENPSTAFSSHTHTAPKTTTSTSQDSSLSINSSLTTEQLVNLAQSPDTTRGHNLLRPEQQSRTFLEAQKNPENFARLLANSMQIDRQKWDKGATISPNPHLVAKNLQVGWERNKPVVDNINLEISTGKATAIVGPSGIGKTTILATLAGIIPPLGGEITLGGHPPYQLSRQTVCEHLSYTAEDAHIFSTTILENLRVARPDVSCTEAVSLLNQAGLGKWLATLPQGLQTIVGENGASISGGERRRLLLARALAAPAPFLLLDEPGEHLDPQVADTLMRDLIRLKEAGRAIIVITHRLSALKDADQIILLGKPEASHNTHVSNPTNPPATVVASGSHEQILETNAYYRWALAQEKLGEK